MVTVADASVAIRGDLNPFKKDLKGAEAQTQSLGKKLDTILSPKNLAAGFLGGAAVAGITTLIGGAIKDATDLAESMSKVDVVFGDSSREIQAWAEDSAEAFGQSKQSALEAAGTYGNLFQAFGVGREEATKMSTSLVELAADLASFNNTSVDEALLALRSGLSGETEPLKRFGVALNDVRLKQEALNMGLITTTKEVLPPGIKAQAAYALIMKDTALAQGDFERTSDGLANQQRILQAQLENVSAEIGEKMLPVIVELVSFINDVGIPAFREFFNMFGEVDTQQAEGFFGDIERGFETLGDSAVRINDVIFQRRDAISAAAEQMGIDYMTLRDRVRRIMDQMGVDHEEAFARVTGAWKAAGGDAATILPQSIKQATASVGEAADEMAGQIPEAMEEAKVEAEAVARATPGSLANQLREGIGDYDAAIDELTEVAASSVGDLAERQKIEGILASQQLTDALNSDSTRTRLLAMELVDDLVSDYELIAPGALEAGELVNLKLAAGLRSNLGLTESASEAIVNAAGDPLVELSGGAYGWGQTLSANFVRGMRSYIGNIRQTSIELGDAAAYGLRLRSPAEGGALSEPADRWGMKLGEMFAEGMLASVRGIKNASLAMGAGAVPGLSAPSTALAGATVAGQSMGTTINVYSQSLVPGGPAERRAIVEAITPLVDEGLTRNGRLERRPRN